MALCRGGAVDIDHERTAIRRETDS